MTLSEHPAIFTGWSVRAILDGSKTQTRRVPSVNNCLIDGKSPRSLMRIWKGLDWDDKGIQFYLASIRVPYSIGSVRGLTWHRITPKWQVGDVLWVRETWKVSPGVKPTVEFKAGGSMLLIPGSLRWDPYCRWLHNQCLSDATRWHASIHMPQWACRLRLKITEVRAQRLQDISREDIRAEGIPETWGEAVALGLLTVKGANAPHMWDNSTAREQWRLVWDALNAKRGWGWEKNRPVFAFTFEVMT